MKNFLYILIFIIGSFFGSFFTLAVYRIPKKEDILIKHSYCPNCNHKLGFFDLFPIFSYIFLGGKCRYCGLKIRPRYLILEVFSGITFLILAIVTKTSIESFNSIISLAFLLVYISILFIIAGIDKENVKIEKSVITVGYIIEIIYIIYQCTLGNINVYQYVIYLLMLLIILLLTSLSLKIFLKEKYYIQILYLSLYIIMFCGSKTYIISTIFALMITAIYKIINKKKTGEMQIGFFLCIANIITIIILELTKNYII
jgi:leader peptidase (prepilin peptidase) / N-methyltransferase